MDLYSVGPHDNVQRLDMDVDLQITTMRTLGRGAAYAGVWRPLPVSRLKKPGKRRAEDLCDITAVAATEAVPVMSARAKQVFEPIFGADAEWLPLAFDECKYWLLKSLRLLDALDLSHASIRRLPHGPVSNIEAYAFQPSLVEQEELTGFFFQPVWDSEHKPFRPTPGPAEILSRPEIYGPGGIVTNLQEYWPPEWKEQARQMKVKTKEAGKARS